MLATEAAFDRELFLKEYDAQITLQVDPVLGVQDQKLNLSGSKRRQLHFFKCTVHSIDRLLPVLTLAESCGTRLLSRLKRLSERTEPCPIDGL